MPWANYLYLQHNLWKAFIWIAYVSHSLKCWGSLITCRRISKVNFIKLPTDFIANFILISFSYLTISLLFFIWYLEESHSDFHSYPHDFHCEFSFCSSQYFIPIFIPTPVLSLWIFILQLSIFHSKFHFLAWLHFLMGMVYIWMGHCIQGPSQGIDCYFQKMRNISGIQEPAALVSFGPSNYIIIDLNKP